MHNDLLVIHERPHYEYEVQHTHFQPPPSNLGFIDMQESPSLDMPFYTDNNNMGIEFHHMPLDQSLRDYLL